MYGVHTEVELSEKFVEIVIPSLGLTGELFKDESSSIKVVSQGSAHEKFIAEVDNTTDLISVRNLLMSTTL